MDVYPRNEIDSALDLEIKTLLGSLSSLEAAKDAAMKDLFKDKNVKDEALKGALNEIYDTYNQTLRTLKKRLNDKIALALPLLKNALESEDLETKKAVLNNIGMFTTDADNSRLLGRYNPNTGEIV